MQGPLEAFARQLNIALRKPAIMKRARVLAWASFYRHGWQFKPVLAIEAAVRMAEDPAVSPSHEGELSGELQAYGKVDRLAKFHFNRLLREVTK